MDRAAPTIAVATLPMLLLLGPATSAAQQPAAPTAAGGDERPFQEPAAWRFEPGTDTTFALSDEGERSTNEPNDQTSNFDMVHMRLYGRLRYSDSVELVVDLFSANGVDPSIYGLHLRLQPDRRLGIRMGILPLVVGGWQDRAYPQRQPLINQPLFTQYLVPLRNDSVPSSVDDLLARRGRRGETRYDLGAPGTGSGVALLYEHCWNPGIELLGELGSFRYRAAVMGGPPGSPLLHARDHLAGPTFAGRLTWMAGDALRLGASWARGPYLQDRIEDSLPPGRTAADYDQQVLGGDLRLRLGRVEVHGEYAWNAFDSPFVPDRLETHAAYGELAIRVVGQLEVAGRFSALRHSDVTSSEGARASWEAGARRLELGTVYRLLDRHLAFKVGWQRTWLDVTPQRVEDIAAAQVAISY